MITMSQCYKTNANNSAVLIGSFEKYSMKNYGLHENKNNIYIAYCKKYR